MLYDFQLYLIIIYYSCYLDVSLTPFLEGLVILRKKESDTKIMNGFSKH